MDIYQHFRKEEHEFIDQVLEWKHYVENNYAQKLTDFLDPREQQIAQTIIGTTGDVQVAFFGGTEHCERKRALFYPSYFQMTNDDFFIELFEVHYPKKFVTIEHREVLGSLMSLGLKRSKFGDILIKDERIQFFVAEEISDYVQLHFESIGRNKIKLERCPLESALPVFEEWQEMQTTVQSLRLDTVISSVHNLSRQKAKEFILQGYVKVNWQVIEDPAFACDLQDIISVRKYGRTKLVSITGKTKKEKIRIIVGKQK